MSAFPAARIARAWPPEPRAWEIAWEVSFRALSSQSLSDGSVSLGGRSFTVSNSANASTFRVEAGVGLEIAPVAGTDDTPLSPNAPMLAIDLIDLLPDFHNNQALFVQLEVDSSGLDDTGQAFGAALDAPVTGGGLYANGTRLEARYDAGVVLHAERVWNNNRLADEVPATGLRWTGHAWNTWRSENRWSASLVRPRPDEMPIGVPCTLGANGGFAVNDWPYRNFETHFRLYAFRETGANSFTGRWRSMRIWRRRFDRGTS